MKVILQDVCSPKTSNLAQKDLIGRDGDYPVYGASGYIGNINFYHQANKCVAVVKDGAGIGRTMLLPEKSTAIGTMQYLIPKENILLEYLFYAVKNMHLEKYYTGATIPHIYFKDYKNEKFNYVDLEQQLCIVNTLKLVEGIISKKTKQLEQLDNLVKSLFIEMFGDPILNPRKWDIRKLNEITALITNGNTPKGGDKNYVDDGILFIRSQNVWKKQLILDDVAYIDTATHKSMKKSSVHNKDILITKTGRVNTENSSLGRAALFCGLDDSANINGHVYLVRLNGTIMPEYVVEVLTSDAYRKYIRKVCVGGIDKRQINLEQVEDFPIIIPPIENQRIFVFYIKNINKHKLLIID